MLTTPLLSNDLLACWTTYDMQSLSSNRPDITFSGEECESVVAAATAADFFDSLDTLDLTDSFREDDCEDIEKTLLYTLNSAIDYTDCCGAAVSSIDDFDESLF